MPSSPEREGAEHGKARSRRFSFSAEAIATGELSPALALDPPRRLRFLDREVLRAAAVFPADRRRVAVEPSTLNRARILEYQRRGYRLE